MKFGSSTISNRNWIKLKYSYFDSILLWFWSRKSNDLSESFFENRNLNLRGDRIIYIKVRTILELNQILTNAEIWKFLGLHSLIFVEILISSWFIYIILFYIEWCNITNDKKNQYLFIIWLILIILCVWHTQCLTHNMIRITIKDEWFVQICLR